MTRYRGRRGAKAVEHEFPHFVDVVVPPGGLGTSLDAMYDFHAQPWHLGEARPGTARR